MGKLRAMSWDYVFYTAAISIAIMFLITIFFYKEPQRDLEGITLRQKFRDIGIALSDYKFVIFLIILGLFYWMPFWSFINITAVYINDFLDTAKLYNNVSSVIGAGITKALIASETNGVWRINAEAISNTGYVIILFQVLISRVFEKRKAIPSFLTGILFASLGFIILGISAKSANWLVFLGVFIFAIGEMVASPRIQEYIMWIAPKEKAGLYMGTNFLAIFVGALLSGLYTGLMGRFETSGHPENVMFILSAHLIVGIIVIFIFTKTLGGFKERIE
jgi:MFS family permease